MHLVHHVASYRLRAMSPRCSRRQCALHSAAVCLFFEFVSRSVCSSHFPLLLLQPTHLLTASSSLMSAPAASSPFTSATAAAAAPLDTVAAKIAELEAELKELKDEIKVLKAQKKKAGAAQDALLSKLEARRDKLEDMLIEYQRKENLLLQAQQQAPKSAASGQCKRSIETLIVRVTAATQHFAHSLPSMHSAYSVSVLLLLFYSVHRRQRSSCDRYAFARSHTLRIGLDRCTDV
jgi:hypothetical protein